MAIQMSAAGVPARRVHPRRRLAVPPRKKRAIRSMAFYGGIGLPTAGVHASMGSETNQGAGVRSCIQNGSLKGQPGGMWGGICVITLPSGQLNMNDSHDGIYNINMPGTLPLGIAAVNTLWPGSATVKLTSAFTVSLNGVIQGKFPAGYVLSTQTPNGYIGSTVPTHNPLSTAPSVAPLGNGIGPMDGHIQNSKQKWTLAGLTSGELVWTLSVPSGRTLLYPNIILYIGDRSLKPSYSFMQIGVGGDNGQSPTPTTRPLVARIQPHCSAITGMPVTSDFGTATPLSMAGDLNTSSTVPAHTISLTCSADASGNASENITLYATSSNLKSGDGTTLLSRPGDWMGQYFRLPASVSSDATLAAGQALSQRLKWSGNSPTPLWT
ncbi:MULTISPECIES: hypothetical protein [Enterobacter]|nr:MULTISPECIES: hypothetical protein [Enterobacter]AMZ77781.1 hypothetical protein A4308_12550 [Enterobacter sp. ODB01]EKS6337614.1 hypothetical protein [Enterobacter hormaechei]VAL43348.1 Uncharacterised protein [Enterobacter kobei]